jgi:16S rRNA (uracil1498-N3)-methyltransferase
MDYAIQKSTELGVKVIAPLFTEYCEVKLDPERSEKRLAHWQQLAISACEQCGRVCPPRIEAPQALSNWLAATPPSLKLLLDHQQQEALPDTAPEEGVVLLIGPEGGFSEHEIALARRAGFRGIALGPRVLRTETAPVAALSVIQYLWGDR